MWRLRSNEREQLRNLRIPISARLYRTRSGPSPFHEASPSQLRRTVITE